MATFPKSRSAYPSRLQKATSQRTPFAYISGSAVNNTTGAVKSNNTASLVANVDDDKTNRIYGPVLLNSDEFGATPITGSSLPNAVTQVFANNVTKKSHSVFKFSRDVSASPIKAGGWDYRSKQLISTIYPATMATNAITNGGFASNLTGWTVSGSPEWDSGHASITAGSITQASLSITINKHYRIAFIISNVLVNAGITQRPLTVSLYETATPSNIVASGNFNTNGTHYIDFYTNATIANCTIKFLSSTSGIAYAVDDVTLQEITAEDIDTTFGSGTDTLKFANGKTQSQRTY